MDSFAQNTDAVTRLVTATAALLAVCRGLLVAWHWIHRTPRKRTKRGRK